MPKSESKLYRAFHVALPQIIVVIISIIVASAVIAMLGYNIFQVISELFIGAFGSPYYVSETLVRSVPLILTGLAFTIAFRAAFWNIGAEGQMWMGALLAAGFGIFITAPSGLHHLLVVILAFVGGLAWGLIPGFLKAKIGVNEVLTTLMMNYVAYWVAYYMIIWPWDDPNAYIMQTYSIQSTAVFPRFVPELRIHTFIIVALLCAAILYFILNRTKLGYELLSLGANPKAAEIGGINVRRTLIVVSMLSGGLAGLAGGSEVLGLMYVLEPYKIVGLGYLGIGVSVLGRANPIGTVLAAIFIGAVLCGADNLQRTLGLGVSEAAVNTFAGVTIVGCLLTPLIMKMLIAKRREIS